MSISTFSIESTQLAAAPFHLRLGSDALGELTVASFTGREEMSRPYAINIIATVIAADPRDLEASLLGQPGCLIMSADDEPRVLRGVVASVRLDGMGLHDRLTFRVRLVPRLAMLKHRRNSRIFQDQSIPEIVSAILGESAVPYAWRTTATYPARLYCVQYQESDLAFVSRLLAEVGIFYFFEHSPESGPEEPEIVIFGDSTDAYRPISGDPKLLFHYAQETGAMVHKEHHVQQFGRRGEVRSKAVITRDYDFRRPRANVHSVVDAGNPTSRTAPKNVGRPSPSHFEVYDHPTEYDDPTVHPRATRAHLEQLRARAAVGDGASACRRLLPGHRFSLDGHDVDPLNAKYVITRVDHRAQSPEAADKRQAVYENSFECVPAAVSFRPPTVKRKIRQVVETAIVVGPDQQEIHTDEHGRIKVQFHWDNEGTSNEHSSCWIRVMQAWSGAGWGFQFIPRVTMEVVVVFLSGDPDRPLIIGSVNNAVQPVSHTLPARGTRSGIRTQTSPGGGGYNELAFEDLKGSEAIMVHAQRDLDETVNMDHSTSVGGDQSVSVVGSQFESVGMNQLESIGGDQAQLVSGNQNELVSKEKVERVLGDTQSIVMGARYDSSSDAFTSVDHSYNLHVGDTMRFVAGTGEEPGHIDVQASGDHTLGVGQTARIVAQKSIEFVCGESSIVMTPRGVSINAKKLHFHGVDTTEMLSKGIHVSGTLELSGKAVKIVSAGASLVLDADAHLDGANVLLNCGGAGAGGPSGGAPSGPVRPLSLRLLDGHFKPFAGKKYRVLVEGKEHEGTTKPDGSLNESIPADAENGTVTVWTDSFPDGPKSTWVLALGPLQPAASVPGAQQRLQNLGYYVGAITDEMTDGTHAAVREFQTTNRLVVNGQLDRPTVAQLVAIHGY